MEYLASGTDQASVWDSIGKFHPSHTAVPTSAKAMTPYLITGSWPGTYTADWWLSKDHGIVLQNVRFTENAYPGNPHKITEHLEWQNFITFTSSQPTPVGFVLDRQYCEQVYMLFKGERSKDHKKFAWGFGAHYCIPTAKFKLKVDQFFLFGLPEADQEPTASAVAVKCFPVLMVNVMPAQGLTDPCPSVGADLKLVFAQRLTRADQHRPVETYTSGSVSKKVDCYDPASRHDSLVISTFADTNDPNRAVIGSGIDMAPKWDKVFDYGDLDIQVEKAFQAVTYPRSSTPVNNPFTIAWPGNQLTCYREPGQGQYDNVHIHPYVGFDDPGSSQPSGTNTTLAMIESPAAADEVIHMHWRWGLKIPNAAIVANVGKAKPDQINPAMFEGYSDLGPGGNLPNSTPGRPMIPANQSLRLKVGRVNPPTGDNGDDPPNPPAALDAGQVAIWYRVKVHDPNYATYTTFFGHGFGLAFFLKKLTPFGKVAGFFGAAITNDELLDAPDYGTPAKAGYHNFRFDLFGNQRVATETEMVDLSVNRLGPGVPGSTDADVVNKK